MATLSILGLYNYDPTIFDNMAVPEELDRDELVKNILIHLAELEVIYPRPDFFKMAVSTWSNTRVHTWERMAEVLYETYDPFINIKRDEVRTITEERDLTNTGSQNVTNSQTDTAESTSDSTVTGKVNAWNTTDFNNRDQSVTSTGSGEERTSNRTGTLTDTSKNTGTVTTTEHFHVEGDSAITDAQDVLKKEMDVRIRFNLYDIITEEFKERFCVMVY